MAKLREISMSSARPLPVILLLDVSVHERGQHRAGDHDDEDHRHFTAAGNPHDLGADHVRYAGAGEAFAQDEHRPDGDDRAVAEPGKGAFGVDETGDRQRAKHQQRNEIHADDFADEQNQRHAKNDQDY